VESLGLKAPPLLRTRGFGFWLVVLAAVGLALRLGYAVAIAPGVVGLDDDSFFHQTALELADGHGYVATFSVFLFGEKAPTASHPPLYPLALSLLARVGARSVGAQQLLGVATGTLTIAAVGLLGRRVAGARAGLAAAALCAVYPSFIAADGAIMSESLFGCIVAFALLQTLVLLSRPSLWGAALLGLLVGLAALTRSEGLLLVPLLALPLLVAAPAHRLRLVATMAAVAALAISPWVIRNAHVFGQFVYSTNDGNTLAGANCDRTYYGDTIGGFRFECLLAVRQPKTENEAVRASALRAAGRRYARDHLGRAIIVAGVRFARVWGFYAPSEQFHVTGRDRDVQRVGVFVFYAVLAAGLVGAVLLFRRGAALPLSVLLVPIVLASFTAVTTYGLVRLRHVAEVSLLVLAGVAVARLPRRAVR
jgi:4-amino-4-deoxy-L-arabinose transferase-like glycosyltransferase